MAKDLNAMVDALNHRVDDHEPIARFIARTQIEQLAKAEELRRAAVNLVRSKWWHKCSDGVGGCVAVSDSKLGKLETALKDLLPFHKGSRIPKCVRELIAPPKRRRGRKS